MSHSINWLLTPSQMRSIAFSSVAAAVALTGCVISRPPYCLLPGEGCLRFVYCDTNC